MTAGSRRNVFQRNEDTDDGADTDAASSDRHQSDYTIFTPDIETEDDSVTPANRKPIRMSGFNRTIQAKLSNIESFPQFKTKQLT